MTVVFIIIMSLFLLQVVCYIYFTRIIVYLISVSIIQNNYIQVKQPILE